MRNKSRIEILNFRTSFEKLSLAYFVEFDRRVELSESMGIFLSVDNHTGGEQALVGVWNASRTPSSHLLEEIRREFRKKITQETTSTHLCD